ncbi:MAG: O-antigen ligase family protein [Candidatus Omnitrophota bacterium]
MRFRLNVPFQVHLARMRAVEEFFFLVGVFFLPMGKSVAEIAFLVALGLWLTGKILAKTPLKQIGVCNIAYFLFLIIALFSFTRAAPDQLTTAARGFCKWLKFFGIFFMTAEFASDRGRLGRLLKIFLASMAVVSANGLVQMWRGTDLIKNYSIDIPGRYVRLQSSFGSPNDLASFLLLALPLSFGEWLKKITWSVRSAGLAVMTGVFFSVLVLTFSRGAFLALMTSLILYFIIKKKFLPLALLAAFAIIFVFSSQVARYNFADSLRLKDITVGERLELWRSTVDLIKTHPILGSGINLHSQNLPHFARPGQRQAGYSHNCYLQMAGEVGLAGLALFLLPLLRILVASLSARAPKSLAGYEDFLWIGIVAYLIQSAFDTNFYALQTAYLFWIAWGAFAGQTIPAARKNTSKI